MLRRANVVSGAVLTALSLLLLFVVIPAQIEPGPDGIISPRLVPNMMMIVVAALSALLVLTNLRQPAPGDDDLDGDGLDGDGPDTAPITPGEYVALLKFATLFAVAIALFVWVSPLAAGLALVTGALLLLGERRPLVLLPMPTLFLLALWLLFYKVLGTAIV